MVNYIRLAWKFTHILRTYRTCKPIVGFLKYEFNNNLLGVATLCRVTPSRTWTPLYIYRERERETDLQENIHFSIHY